MAVSLSKLEAVSTPPDPAAGPDPPEVKSERLNLEFPRRKSIWKEREISGTASSQG